MEIKTILSGPCDNNTYVVSDDKNAIIIDASCSVDEIESTLNGKKLSAIFVTHGHYDHVANLDMIAKKYDVKVYLTAKAFDKLNEPSKNCSSIFGVSYKTSLNKTDFVFVENNTILDFIDNYPIKVYRTNGHTDCGVCLKFGDNILFSGDTIFYRSYGRTDMPTGDSIVMRKTLEYIIKTFKGYTIYSGHGISFVL